MTTLAATREQGSSQERAHLHAYLLDDETREVVEQVIGELMIPHAAALRGGIRQAIAALCKQRSPKLLIVDISDTDIPLSDVNELAEVCEPGVTVIAVGDRNDVGLFRQLVSHGVSDYLVKPITPTLLQRSLLSAVEGGGGARQTTRLGRLIVTLGSRGGVGSTLAATTCAWEIATRRKRRVALLDLDLQLGSCALSLDLDPSHGFREAMENASRIDSLYVERAMARYSETLFVLSAEEGLEETVDPDKGALELLLNELRSKFHFVVVDLPRSMNEISRHVLATATNLVLVSDLSLAGMRDTLRLLQFLPSFNASCQITMVANRVGEHRQGELARKDFEKGIGRKIDVMMPFDGRHVAQAINAGQPVAGGNSILVPAITQIAEAVTGSTRKQPPSALQRLRKLVVRA